MMPTFTTIALDRLIEPGSSRSASDSKLDRSNSTPARVNGDDSLPVLVPHHRKPDVPLPPPAHRRNSSSSLTKDEKEKAPWPQISPSLYSTPKSTPLPDSPTLLNPSPYIINHKRRGPRLQKSFSEASVMKKEMMDEKVPSSNNLSGTEVETKSNSLVDECVVTEQSDSAEENKPSSLHQEMIEKVVFNVNVETKDLPGTSSVDKESESEDFYDMHDSMSVASHTDGEDNGNDHSGKTTTNGGVFYDAWDDLSSDGGRQMLSAMHDLDTELREMRLNFLMEIEKRKQAEDALNSMRSQWQRLREELRELGLVLPTDLSINADFTEEICQQIYVTRFVSESIGRVAAIDECEEEMRAQLESKNFEIARLSDRLHYYEIMNQEMSQRNQEVIELARRDRQRRNKIQKWVWGSIAATVTLGGVALAWSYMPSGKEASSSHELHAPKPDTSTQ